MYVSSDYTNSTSVFSPFPTDFKSLPSLYCSLPSQAVWLAALGLWLSLLVHCFSWVTEAAAWPQLGDVKKPELAWGWGWGWGWVVAEEADSSDPVGECGLEVSDGRCSVRRQPGGRCPLPRLQLMSHEGLRPAWPLFACMAGQIRFPPLSPSM